MNSGVRRIKGWQKREEQIRKGTKEENVTKDDKEREEE